MGERSEQQNEVLLILMTIKINPKRAGGFADGSANPG